MPSSTSTSKVALIEALGGRCHFVAHSADVYAEAEWIAGGAGTGGTSATVGRYDTVIGESSRIEGIGRPRVEPSFLPDVVDRMMAVPDAASVATARHVSAVSADSGDRYTDTYYNDD